MAGTPRISQGGTGRAKVLNGEASMSPAARPSHLNLAEYVNLAEYGDTKLRCGATSLPQNVILNGKTQDETVWLHSVWTGGHGGRCRRRADVFSVGWQCTEFRSVCRLRR